MEPILKSMILSVSMFVIGATASAAPKATPELLTKGKTSYATNCAMCHGDKGDADSPAGQAMIPKPRNFLTMKFVNGDKPEQIFDSITKGLPGTTMMAYGHIPEEDRWGLSYYIKSLQKAGKGSTKKAGK